MNQTPEFETSAAESAAEPYEPIFHVVLHEPEIPPNTGNVGRTCVAVGAKLWLVRPLGFDVGEKARRRAGLDYWQYLNWQVVDNWSSLVQCLPTSRLWLFSKKASRTYTDASFRRGDALVFGKETAGLPADLVEQFANQTLRIPMRPQVRSLNLSCSVGVVAFEAVRQIHLADSSQSER